MYTPTRIAGREAVFEFLRHKLRAYRIIFIISVSAGISLGVLFYIAKKFSSRHLGVEPVTPLNYGCAWNKQRSQRCGVMV